MPKTLGVALCAGMRVCSTSMQCTCCSRCMYWCSDCCQIAGLHGYDRRKVITPLPLYASGGQLTCVSNSCSLHLHHMHGDYAVGPTA
jgi:hypothetical protein